MGIGEGADCLSLISSAKNGPDSTRLRVVESGFRDLAVGDDEKQRHHDGHRRGWELELGELEEYVRGQVRSRAER